MSAPQPAGALPGLEVPHIRNWLSKFLSAVGGRHVLVEDAVWANIPSEINMRLQVLGDSAVLTFNAPGPTLTVQYGISYTARVQNITVSPTEICIGLEKFPDFKLRVVS